MPPALTITPYSDPAHRSQVISLWQSVFAYDAPHNRPAVSIDKKLAANDGLFFVALSDDSNSNSVIGTIMAGYDGHRGWIYSVAVDPRYRRQGIGGDLLLELESILASLGCLKVNLQVRASNVGVIAFYEKLGFAVEQHVSMGKRLY
jgi:ribosomal protein S18 acetylase RimI-like enzyme